MMGTRIFMAVLFVTTKYCKPPKWPSMGKLTVAHSYCELLAVKMSKLATTTHNMDESQKHNLNKRNQTLKSIYGMTPGV